MDTLRFSRRTFVAWVGGAGAGFYLFGRVPGLSAPIALAQISGGTLDPTSRSQVPDAAAHPPGDAPRRHVQVRRRQDRRPLRDLDEAVLAADPARRSACHHGVGLRRGRVESKRGCSSTTRPRSRSRPSGTARSGSSGSTSSWTTTGISCRICCRSTRRCTGRIRPAAWTVATAGPTFDRDARAATPARCRWSLTCTAPSVSATRATATPRPGTSRPPSNIPAGLRHEGHVVRLLRRQGAASLRRGVGAGLRDLPVPERPAGRRRSGTTTTRSA